MDILRKREGVEDVRMHRYSYLSMYPKSLTLLLLVELVSVVPEKRGGWKHALKECRLGVSRYN